MYKALVYLMALAALTQLGIRISDLATCQGRACLVRIEKASRDVLKINWRPISVFPEEAIPLGSKYKRKYGQKRGSR